MRNNVRPFFIAIVLLIIGWHTIVYAGTTESDNQTIIEQGIKYFQEKNYAQARKLWLPLAKKGDIRAQYNLALLSNISGTKNNYLLMSREGGLVDAYFVKAKKTVQTPKKRIEKAKLAKHGSIEPLNWLKQQPKTYYTLQLETGINKKSMQATQDKLLASNALLQKNALYIQKIERKQNNKVIANYILLYGSFDSYQNAKDEVERLPESIQKSSPWIRQFSTLQSKVDNVQKRAVQTVTNQTQDVKLDTKALDMKTSQ